MSDRFLNSTRATARKFNNLFLFFIINYVRKGNIIFNYFDNMSFKKEIDYINNGVNQTMNSNTTSSNDNNVHNVSIHIYTIMENLRKY